MKLLQPVLLFVFCFPFILHAQFSQPSRSIQPAWVKLYNISYNETQLDKQASYGYVDIDFEKQISLSANAVFYKKITKVLEASGIATCSGITVDYNPAYQALSFHTLRIIRGAKIIDKLQSTRFDVQQLEKERDYLIYNGMLTASVTLDDVKKGDIVEYSYTITGFNPVFKGKYADDYTTQFNAPIYYLYYRLSVPTGRKMTIKNKGTGISPVTSAEGSNTVYEWKQTNMPASFGSGPYVMVSEFRSWKDVNDWARQLFAPLVNISKPLHDKVMEMNATSATPEEKILKALHFVQDDVRYLGVEMGVNSHQPHSPNQVFDQRFGDCKDKTYLLCTMLHMMNIQAWPVLVNTNYKTQIFDWLPSAFAFDHATVMVRLNGKDYYFDPTIPYQRGNLNSITYRDYEAGLIVSDFTTELTNIDAYQSGKSTVREEFTFTDVKSPATFKVTSTFSGSLADQKRYEIKNVGKNEMFSRYKDFYAVYFKDLIADTIFTQENDDGSLTLIEKYTISKPLDDISDGGIALKAYLIDNVFGKSIKMFGSYNIDYPFSYHEEVQVTMPDGWHLDHTTQNIQNSSFKFTVNYSEPNKQTALMVFDFESLQDDAAYESDEYKADIRKVINNVNFLLSPDKAFAAKIIRTKDAMKQPVHRGHINYGYLGLIVGVLLLVVIIAWRKLLSRQS